MSHDQPFTAVGPEYHADNCRVEQLKGTRAAMGFLAAIIPGFRTLRTPITAGVLWISTFVIIAVTHNVHIHFRRSLLNTANTILPDWFGVVVIPIILTAAYLLGAVLVGLANPIVLGAIDIYRYALLKIGRPYDYTKSGSRSIRETLANRINKLFRRASLISVNAHSLIVDYVMSALTDAGATGSAAMTFPFDSMHVRLTQCSAQLSQVAPAQYQEWDRIQAEAEFRTAVVPPLLVMSCLLPAPHHPFVVLGITFASVVLLGQSVSLSRQANDILASAARFGYLVIPEIKSLTTFLADIDPKPTSDGSWAGAIIIGLYRRGFFEESDAMMEECTEYDQKHDVSLLASYLASTDGDLAAEFDRKFQRNRGVKPREFQGSHIHGRVAESPAQRSQELPPTETPS